jgi:hypothetical protein
MIAVPLSPGLVGVRFDRIEVRISSVAPEPVRPIV